MAAALVPRELLSWSMTALALGALEGGLLGVIVKNQFADVAGTTAVNLAVAVVAGAPAFANLASSVFAARAMGRDKIALMSRLMQFIGLCLIVMVLPGKSAPGLVIFCATAVLGRMAWSGIITIRAAVWRVNYERQWRGRVTARIVQLAGLLIALFSALVGHFLDWREDAYRWVFLVAAGCAFLAAHFYSKTRVRRHRQLLAAEHAEHAREGRQFSIGAALSIFRRDVDFRRYMGGMMIFGSGNLMVTAMLVIMINDYFSMKQLEQVMIIASIPLLLLCLTITSWARLLEGRHIFAYRALQSWTFVAAIGTFAVAMITQLPWLLWPGAILLGTAFGGGHLGWNLGHNDFSSDANASMYMTIHVTLTGIRGLLMPVIGVLVYQRLEGTFPGQGVWAMLFPFSLSFLGSCWFVWLHVQRRNDSGRHL